MKLIDKLENQENIKELRYLQEEVDEVLEYEDEQIMEMMEKDPKNLIKLMRSGFLMLSGFVDAYIEGLKRLEDE